MSERIFTVDKFLGLNESGDGTTELKLGEASKMENFYITDGYNLKTRPGIVRYLDLSDTGFSQMFSVYKKDKLWLGCITDNGISCTLDFFHGEEHKTFHINGPMRKLIIYEGQVIAIWENLGFADDPDATSYIPSYWNVVCSYLNFENENVDNRPPYEPLVSSDGEELEPRNLLYNCFRVSFTADGTKKDYELPSITDSLTYVSIDGHKYEPAESKGTYDSDSHTFTFTIAPTKGSEIVFGCFSLDSDIYNAQGRFWNMPYHEYYNGYTDTRIFFYGDGSNICYYTGVPANGSGLYIPAGNEIAVAFSDSPITSMVRHYSRLLAFKPDGVEAIFYDTMTLEDGRVIPGFYLRPVSRDFGNEAPGQVALVNNNPISFSHGSLYEWRITSSSYRDERYAKCISQKVAKTLSGADPAKVITCDDDASKTYYVFLNDDEGTVLVYHYDLDVWTIYRSALTCNVSQAIPFEGKLLFLKDGIIFAFDPDTNYDDGSIPINAIWESGYMSFGADYKRKYSSNIWLSMLPESASNMEVTVQTDKRDNYLAKSHGFSLFDFSKMDFSAFSFLTRTAPMIKRIKIKVKKFVYYKLIFRVIKPGARATVLGYDQQVRYSSNVK